MFNSITSAISNFFKPKTTSTSTLNPFSNTSTSPNPFSQTSSSPNPLTSAVKSTSPNPLATNVLAGVKAGGSSTMPTSTPLPVSSSATPAIQNRVLSTPVTVSALNTAPTSSPIFSTPTSTFQSVPIVDRADTTTQPKVTGRESALERILALNEQQAGQAERQRVIEEENQLAEKQERLNALNARAMSVDREYENKRRSILENPEGKLSRGLQGEIRNLETQRDQQLADIGIQQAVAQGDVQLAQSRIKQRVDAEFEPIKSQIANLEKYLSLYADDLTSSEKIMLEQSIKLQNDTLKSGLMSAENQAQAQYYAQGISSGSIQMSEVPQDIRGAVLGYMQQNGVVDGKEAVRADEGRVAMQTINDLLGSPFGTAVGSGLQRTLGKAGAFIGVGTFAEKDAKIKNLKAQLTLEILPKMRGLGAMSELEFSNLQNSIGALNPNMSESAFTQSLVGINSKISDFMLKSHSVDITEKAQILTNKIRLERPDATEAQVAETVRSVLPQYMSSFKQAGNASASTLRNAIVAQESGGSYTIVNKDSGALGKYQIMPSNLKNLVGLADTPENRKKFLNSPQLQDKAFDNLLAELSKAYGGDTRKILAAYYGGGGAAKVVGTPAGDRPQGGGKYPSINQYVNQVLNKINTA